MFIVLAVVFAVLLLWHLLRPIAR